MLRAAIFCVSPCALLAAVGAALDAINGDGIGAASCAVASVMAVGLWISMVSRVRRDGYRDAVEGRPLR